MDISQFSFDHLTLRKGPEKIQHSPEYIKKGEGRTASRRIFYGTTLDHFERQQIQALENDMQENGLSMLPGWTDRETLKYLYATKFDRAKAIKRIQACIEWRDNPASRTITRDVLRLFESGALYMYGRDKQYRPIIVFDFGKVDFNKIKGDDFNVAITILLDIAIRYCYAPGKVENNIIIIDTRELSLTKLPISTMKAWIEIGNACFPSNMFKTYIVGPPFLLKMSWGAVKALMEEDTAEKLEVLALDELHKMQSVIDASQLERKFGGTVPNLTTFWPPSSSMEEPLSSRQSFNESFDQQSLHNGSFHQTPPRQHRVEAAPNSYLTNNLRPEPGRYTAQPQHRDTPPVNERFTSAPRIEPSGIIDNRYVTDPHQDRRYTTGSRIEPSGLSDRTSRNQIFDTRPGRASQGVNHSPMRVRDKDENLIKEIISTKPKPIEFRTEHPPLIERPVQHERVKKSSVPVFTAVRDEVLDTFGDDRTKEKRLDEKLDRQLSMENRRRTSEREDPSVYTKLNSRKDLMDMIMKEDKYIKKHSTVVYSEHDEPRYSEPRQSIPEENTQIHARISGRGLGEAKLKPHTDYSQKAHPEPSYQSYQPYQHNASFSHQDSFEYKPITPAESLKKSVRFHDDEQPYQRLDTSSYQQYSQQRDLRDSPSNRHVEEWPKQHLRELKKPGNDSDEDDEDTNFCGICVSTEGRKKKRAMKY